MTQTPHEYSKERVRAFSDLFAKASFSALDVLNALEDMTEDEVAEFNDHVLAGRLAESNAMLDQGALTNAAATMLAARIALDGMPL